MPDVRIKLIGFGEKASGLEAFNRQIPEGTSFQILWEEIQREAQPGSLLSETNERKVLFLLNGRLLRGTAARSQTVLSADDQVTIMVLAAGG